MTSGYHASSRAVKATVIAAASLSAYVAFVSHAETRNIPAQSALACGNARIRAELTGLVSSRARIKQTTPYPSRVRGLGGAQSPRKRRETVKTYGGTALPRLNVHRARGGAARG